MIALQLSPYTILHQTEASSLPFLSHDYVTTIVNLGPDLFYQLCYGGQCISEGTYNICIYNSVFMTQTICFSQNIQSSVV